MGLRNGGVGWGLAEILSTFVHVSEHREETLCERRRSRSRDASVGRQTGRRSYARLEPAVQRRGPTAIPFRREVTTGLT